MKLYEIGVKKYYDGSIRNFYQMDTLKNCNELKGFLLSFQNEFGDIRDIIVKRYIDNNCVLFYKRYNDLYDFIEKFNLVNIREYNIYEFLCNNMHCKIDSEKDIIDIYRSNYAAYSCEIIDDPLQNISAEELKCKHNKNKAEITARFKEFCCEIEFH